MLGAKEFPSSSCFEEFFWGSVAMVENVVKYQRWSHIYDVAVTKQVMTMTIEPKLLATPDDHWTDLPARVP